MGKETKVTETLETTQEKIGESAKELAKTVQEIDAIDDLADPNKDVIKYEEANTKEQTYIEMLAKEIDIKDPNSVIFFGSKAQEHINTIAESMLEGVQNKDIGTAGDSLNNLVAAIKGFDIDGLNPNMKQGFFSKMLGLASPAVKFMGKYEDVKTQIDHIIDSLEMQKSQLLVDIETLDKLYDVNFEYFKELEVYIAAGAFKLKELDTKIIPQIKKEAGTSKKMAKSLQLQDIVATRNDLERRVHDLRLTRQVSMQALPSIRIVQESDKNIISKINSTIVNTVPLWKNQLAQTVTIYRTAEAAKSIKNANDLTNDLLAENAKNLKAANKAVREEVERGVYDIETIKQANQTLIDTINESLEITNRGQAARKEAEKELLAIEKQLSDALIAAGTKKKRK